MGIVGTLSPQLGNLSFLVSLNISHNSFYGNLPRELASLRRLQYIDFGYNNFSGKIPEEIGNLENTKWVILEVNQLDGPIPFTIFNISTLQNLVLNNNSLSDSLPMKLCQHATRLKALLLHYNKLSGYIPKNLSSCSELEQLRLSYNNFVGTIPKEIGSLNMLQILRLGGNKLEGIIPETIFNMSTLTFISMGNNNLSGILPPNMCLHLQKLEKLYLYKNKLYGNIPRSIGECSSLKYLIMWENSLSGEISRELGNLDRLEILELQYNGLSGFIPWGIFNISTLEVLDLSFNEFSGLISDCLGNISSLEKIYLYENEFTVFPPTLWSIKNLLILDLSSNNLSGSLPQEIGNAKTAIAIDLSNNKLSGDIPSSIGGLTRLINFSVANNKIQGSIPDNFGKLLDLHSLDLSDNKISGMIPKSLEGLISMNYFNASYNKLTGEIPSGGPFVNFTYESFLGNDGLCGTPRMHVPPCLAHNLHQSKKDRVIFIVLVSLAVLIVLIASVSVLYIFKRHNIEEVPDEPNFLSATTPARYSYYELQRATNGFDESNSLGSGSFGSVYKGILTNGMQVAVKVFRLEHEGSNRSFDSECEVLHSIRHRNLTKVLGSCSNLNFKALLLEYMPNGCLHKWLHSHSYFLDMIQRVSIMIDVASALEYLHYGYSNPIIHCDLKPSNVLIDTDMVGHLSDFGVAKLLEDGNSIAITNTLATIGYIAPEYGQEGLISTRSDMYSYGIMLLEVFTKTQPGDEMFSEDLCLRSWVHTALPVNTSQIIDPNLLEPNEEKYDEKLQCVSAIFDIGIKCSTKSPRERMNIKDALSALIKIKTQLLSLYASI
ncbi:probable LRR receptor-like serine/threonine-protein kinase At3g47570 [Ipomoea triloba]|uniref:probable LRR receptor-like serine/threonine-protein kinase At3g47570 n=1 Tax=Ipomoea triloba TaxID=35885 RepID=UPI00125DCFFE|nr:probable LRR receptor-like serine/threonine-protein kinase At3g47570 [Ipomoea triloba]